MSNELESDIAMVTNLEGSPHYDETESEPPSSTNPCLPAVRIMLQVTQIGRFLLERGLRFRNLGFCGHDLM